MTTDLDGTPVDLDRVQLDLDGGQWLWTCEHTDAGEPLMLRLDQPGEPIPLADVYRTRGPIHPQPGRTTAAMYRQVLEAAS